MTKHESVGLLNGTSFWNSLFSKPLSSLTFTLLRPQLRVYSARSFISQTQCLRPLQELQIDIRIYDNEYCHLLSVLENVSTSSSIRRK
ncbi:unnamed protein product [Caenorhabditis brenneri]